MAARGPPRRSDETGRAAPVQRPDTATRIELFRSHKRTHSPVQVGGPFHCARIARRRRTGGNYGGCTLGTGCQVDTLANIVPNWVRKRDVGKHPGPATRRSRLSATRSPRRAGWRSRIIRRALTLTNHRGRVTSDAVTVAVVKGSLGATL
jgi:hypothetical protein